jgi:hypothetical protein
MPIDTARWRQAMLTIPDRAFFDLYRNYFGELPSPHSKQDMLNLFEQLLRETSFRQAMAANLSDDDIWIVNTLHRLEPLPEADLTSLSQVYASEHHVHQVKQAVLALQDRLWIFRDYKTHELAVNPLVADLAAGRANQPADVLGQPSHTPAPQSFLGDSFLASLAVAWPDLAGMIKIDGTLSKRAEVVINRIFAGFTDFETVDNQRTRILDLSVSGWLRLGLATFSADSAKSPKLCRARIASFARLSAADRRWMFAAAAIFPAAEILNRLDRVDGTGPVPSSAVNVGFQSQGILARFAQVLRAFFAQLAPGLTFTANELLRLWHLTIRQAPIPSEIPSLGPHFFDDCIAIGLLSAVGENRFRAQDLDWQHFDPVGNRQIARPGVGGELRIAPQAGLLELLPLVAVSRLTRFGRECLWELDMALARQTLAHDLGADTVLAALGGVASVPAALAFELRQREAEARAVRITPGFLIEVAPIRSTEAQALLATDSAVQKLNDGWYFVPRRADDLVNRLVAAGLAAAPVLDDIPDFLPPFQSLPLESMPHRPIDESANLALPNPIADPVVALVDLERLAAEQAWEANFQAEAVLRISRRLIIHPRQLRFKPEPSERGRAQGLDFAAKLRQIEEAIKNRNEILELRILGSDVSGFLTLWPRQIKGVGAEACLFALTDSEYKEISLMVRKIIELRRIQATISI